MSCCCCHISWHLHLSLPCQHCTTVALACATACHHCAAMAMAPSLLSSSSHLAVAVVITVAILWPCLPITTTIITIVVSVAIAVACIPSMSSCATIALARHVLSSSCCHGSGQTSPHDCQHRHHHSHVPSSPSSSPCPVIVTVTCIHWQSTSTHIAMVVHYHHHLQSPTVVISTWVFSLLIKSCLQKWTEWECVGV